ncbi:RNA recognition motif domain-containing protein [Phthorimaea operculella]|nr:RNA recognition motif domain-containing protein [Phthorimaea operculella]
MNNQNSRNDDRKEEIPPYSRLFVVCSNDIEERDLEDAFKEFGEIENFYRPKDRSTGAPRGVAYVKYAKTSSAAAAIENLDQKTISGSKKPLKVMVASKKDDPNDNSSSITYDRLFLKVPKTSTQEEIEQHFSKFGKVESVNILKDKSTQESKGLAFVKYRSFLEAATAVEECDRKYKAVFAAPKTNDLKRERDSGSSRDDRYSFNDGFNSFNSMTMNNFADFYGNHDGFSQQRNNIPSLLNNSSSMMNNSTSMIKTPGQNYNAITLTCTPMLPQRYLERLCDIVPGMQHFQFTEDSFNGYSKALVTFEDDRAAAHAVDRLNNFEFPSGELVTVKPDNPLSKAADNLTSILSSFKNAVDSGSPDLLQLADAIAQASTLIKAATTGGVPCNDVMMADNNICSVPLPPMQPMARPSATIAKRCFVVCKPRPPPQHILQEIFCRFGDLIDVQTFPNKTFAFARYASERAAQEAIRTLNGQTIYGTVNLKVLEADDKPKDHRNRGDNDHDMEDEGERKRMRVSDRDHH